MKKKSNRKPDLVVAGLLDYLKETGETKILPEVARELEKLLKESKTAEAITIYSYTYLESYQLEKLTNIIRKLINSDLPVFNSIDKSLLGGFTIKVGDWFLDASLAGQLNYLNKALLS